MLNFFGKFINFIEKQSLTFGGWVISFFTLLGLNLFFQFITYDFKNISFEYFIGEIIQPYYFILYLAIVIFLYLITNQKSFHLTKVIKNKKTKSRSTLLKLQKIKKSSDFIQDLQNENIEMINVLKFVLWGFWSIIFWPIIDKLILGDKFHLSFYIYDGVEGIFNNLITFFGPIVPVGILYGTRIETVFIILITGFYIYYKTESLLRVFMGVVGVYIIFYISVALPSILVFLVTILKGNSVLEITNLDVVNFFNTPLKYFGSKERGFVVTFFYKISLFYNLILVGLLIWLQWLWNKNILKSLIKNIRMPQMIFNWGLLLIGIFVGLFYFPENLTKDFFSELVCINLFFIVLFIWLFSVIINDIEDFEIDKISNKNRPLIKGLISKKIYLNYGLVFLFLAGLFSLVIGGKIFVLVVLYIFITLIYSKKPFKLKRIPWVAGIISALAVLLIFLMGYFLIVGNNNNINFPWGIMLFLFGGYALILPIKDLKDINSDKQNNILTVANLLGEKLARIYFGVVIFLIFILTVFIFNFKELFIPAIILGSIAYWIVNNKKNSRNILLYKILGVVIIYLLLVIFI